LDAASIESLRYPRELGGVAQSTRRVFALESLEVASEPIALVPKFIVPQCPEELRAYAVPSSEICYYRPPQALLL
jgi:hypothetical protein